MKKNGEDDPKLPNNVAPRLRRNRSNGRYKRNSLKRDEEKSLMICASENHSSVHMSESKDVTMQSSETNPNNYKESLRTISKDNANVIIDVLVMSSKRK